MKILGLILIAAGAFACGLSYIRSRRESVSDCESVRYMLEHMKSEIEEHLTSLPSLFKKLSISEEGAGKRIAESVSESLPKLGETGFRSIWYAAVGEVLNDDWRNLTELFGLGSVLGRYDAKTQGEAIERSIRLLERREDELRSELEKNSKAALGVPLTCALMLAVFLI